MARRIRRILRDPISELDPLSLRYAHILILEVNRRLSYPKYYGRFFSLPRLRRGCVGPSWENRTFVASFLRYGSIKDAWPRLRVVDSG